jgi:hypothetical protein
MSNEKRPTLNETKIDQVEVIQETGTFITKRENIKKYVETPLVESCEILWDKNIRTVWSSCNAKDFSQGYGVIGIDYNTLSSENKIIAEEIGQLQEDRLGKTLYLKIPLNKNTTIEEAQKISIELANRFKKQKANWVQSFTHDELIASYLLIKGINDEIKKKNPIEDFVGEDGYLDDTVTPARVYPSKELYYKTLEEIN